MHEETARQISVFLQVTHLSTARDPAPWISTVRKDGLITVVYIKRDGRSHRSSERRRDAPAGEPGVERPTSGARAIARRLWFPVRVFG